MQTLRERREFLAYGSAVLGTCVIVALWLALPGDWGEHIPFSLFLMVVGGASVLGGVGPGMLALVLGGFASFYLGPPRYEFTLLDRADWLLLAAFLVTGALTALGGARLRGALQALRRANVEIARRAREEASRLEREVAERTAQLESLLTDCKRITESERAARAEAESASRLKDDFVATVSHELRTPLNAIVGWAQLLDRPGVPGDKLARGLEVIRRNARALADLLADLLDTSRITSGKLKVELSRSSVGPIVEEAIESLRGAAAAKGVELRVTLADAEVMADPGRLQQVVWNLVSNAIKFTPVGGRVDVSVTRDGDVTIRVRDTGEGIDPAFLPTVFERFRQADASAARPHGGLGLGLAIVKHLVGLHGGEVCATSAGLGQGTEVTVTLPHAPASAPRAAGAAPAVAYDLHGLTVLVVDDDPDARDVAQRILEEHGATVVASASAMEALEAFSASHPRVLVSDISMPHMDGYELVRRLRACGEASARDVPAIALTAYARHEDQARALAAGFQTSLNKPIDAAALLRAVATCAEPSARSTAVQ